MVSLRTLLLEPDVWRYRGLREELESSSCEVVGDGAFERYLTAPSAITVDVVLLSHQLVIDHGTALIERVAKKFSAAVLVHGDDRSIEVAAAVMRNGASGYFLLQSSPAQLVEALKVVASGRFWAPREAVALLARGDPPAHVSRRASATVADESLIFRLLDRGLSNKEIGQKLGLAEVTVKARLTKLYRKFGVASRLQLLSAAIRRGHLKTSRDSDAAD